MEAVLIYPIHIAYWASFGVALLITRHRRAAAGTAPASDEVAAAMTSSRFSSGLVLFQGIGFGVMYFGIGAAVFGRGLSHVSLWQRLVAAAVIALGAVLMGWALVHFRSWRLRARLDVGHELATGGPFAIVQHPIYLGLDLLGIGTAIWAPTPILWIAAAWIAWGSDLRARAEERVLRQAFGDRYLRYCRATSRFVPGVY